MRVTVTPDGDENKIEVSCVTYSSELYKISMVRMNSSSDEFPNVRVYR